MQTLKEYLLKSESFLRKKNIEKPRLESQIIFAEVLNLKRYELYIQDEKPLTKEEVNLLRNKLVEKSKHKPTAYLFNKKSFFNEDYYVDENVLIPRPETEELIEIIINTLQEDKKQEYNIGVKCHKSNNLKILDLCSGSGCMGISIQKNIKDSVVFFSDISQKALEITKKNYLSIIDNNLSNEKIFLSDLFNNISNDYDEHFSIIISNPPYVTKEEYQKLDSTVKDFEPEIALLVEKPEKFFMRLFQGAYQKLISGGCIFLETNPLLIKQQKDWLQKNKFSDIIIIKDISNKDRFLYAKKQ